MRTSEEREAMKGFGMRGDVVAQPSLDKELPDEFAREA